ncbi:hypothetical protein Tco_1118392, partial [Tanacetum coccineum]
LSRAADLHATNDQLLVLFRRKVAEDSHKVQEFRRLSSELREVVRMRDRYINELKLSKSYDEILESVEIMRCMFSSEVFSWSSSSASPVFPSPMSRSHEENEFTKLRSSALMFVLTSRIFSFSVKTLKCDHNSDLEIHDAFTSIFEALFLTGSVCRKSPPKRNDLPPNKECGAVSMYLRLLSSTFKQQRSFMGASSQIIRSVSANNFPRRKKIPILDPLAGIFANHLRSLFEYDFVSLYPRLKSRKSAMDNSFTLGSNEETYHVKILQSCNGLLLMAFDPTKSRDYKVVQIFACLHAGLEIHVYSSKTGNLSLCKDWVSYYNFCHFPTSIYWSDAFHWLETEDMQLTLYKFHIDDHGHTIITTLEIPNGFHQGSNFLHSFCAKEGSYDPMFIQIDIPTILHLQRRLFESRGCLLLVSRDDIGFK